MATPIAHKGVDRRRESAGDDDARSAVEARARRAGVGLLPERADEGARSTSRSSAPRTSRPSELNKATMEQVPAGDEEVSTTIRRSTRPIWSSWGSVSDAEEIPVAADISALARPQRMQSAEQTTQMGTVARIARSPRPLRSRSLCVSILATASHRRSAPQYKGSMHRRPLPVVHPTAFVDVQRAGHRRRRDRRREQRLDERRRSRRRATASGSAAARTCRTARSCTSCTARTRRRSATM